MLEGVFWVFGGVAILAAFLCITRASAVASALWLVVALFAIAGLFVILDAQFIAVIQVVVYAGAIMVLFLFVIMLLNLGRGGLTDMRGWPGRVVAVALGGLLVAELLVLRTLGPDEAIRLPTGALAGLSDAQGAVRVIAVPLFRDYLIPFEITALLLLAAIVGSVVLAKRRI